MTAGNPQPTSAGDSTSSGGSSALPAYGAPAVKNPLNMAKFQANMCSSLSPSAQAALHITGPGTASEEIAGPACKWHVAANSTAKAGDLETVSVQAVTKTLMGDPAQGLTSAYAQRSKMQVFEPIGEIGGYPALIASDEDHRPLGICDVGVGVANELVFSVGTGSKPGAGDPCESAKKAAELFVQTVKGGS